MHRDVRIPVVAVFVATIVFGIGLTRAQEEANEAGDAGDHIKRGLFTTAIEEREPVDEIDSLATDTNKVYFFSEIVNMEGMTVTHRWVYGGEALAEVTFNIGGPRWRVWSSKNLVEGWVGEWTVECIDGDGNKMHEATFTYHGME